MADNEYDLCPREQKLRACANILSEEERAIADACGGLLLRLIDPLDLPPGVTFYGLGAYFDTARRGELCMRASRAAMAVLLADAGMQLPLYIETAYDMPADAAPGVRRLIDLARQAQSEIALEAEQRARSGSDENFESIRKLADDLGAAIAEAAA